jgi:AcrR family transcriptional regulator
VTVIAPQLPLPREPALGADATAERLLQAAHELLYDDASATLALSEVCARAEANVAMVKYCFGNKDGLLLALITRITDSFRGDFERLAAEDIGWREKLGSHIGGIARNYLRYPYINRLLADQLQRSDKPGTLALSERFAVPLQSFQAQLLDEGRSAGELRDVDPVLFFFAVVGMCEFIFSARGWLVHGFGLALDDEFVERYVDHVIELVLTGMLTDGREP